MCRTLLLITNIILFFSSCGYNSSTYSPYLSKTKNIQFLVEHGKINWEKRVNIDEAFGRVFDSNQTKLPFTFKNGKVQKGPNYQKPYLKEL